jgi:hypothetical protein
MIELNREVQQEDPELLRSFEPLADGWYTVQVDDVEQRTSNKGNDYLNVRFSVAVGDFVGRKVFERYNIWNSNTVAVDIAWREFDSLARACRKSHVADGDELLGETLDVKLKTEESEGYDPQNKIQQYRSSAEGTMPPPAVTAAAGNGGAAPWLKTA